MRLARCPLCRRGVAREDNPYWPFCSERCRVLDLAAWADGRYRIPGEPAGPAPTGDEDARPVREH